MEESLLDRYATLFPGIRDRELTWFTPAIPTGTAYRAGARLNDLPQLKDPGLAIMEPLYRIAPLHERVARYYYLAKFPHTDDPVALRQILGPLLDYASSSINFFASHSKDDPAAREQALLKETTFDPDAFSKLGRFYVEQGDKPKAAAAYQSMVDQARDQVLVANECGWLVNYYFDTGEKQKALKIAELARDVYSARGLMTYAGLMEKMGDLPAAEKTYLDLTERYDDSYALNAFYIEQARLDPHSPYAAKAAAKQKELFPEGIVDITLADFKAAPYQGTIIASPGPGLAPNGLQVGDIIVALDGKKVLTSQQYTYLRNLKSTPELDLIIYRNGQYSAVHATAKNRMFGCDLKDWTTH